MSCMLHAKACLLAGARRHMPHPWTGTNYAMQPQLRCSFSSACMTAITRQLSLHAEPARYMPKDAS